MNTAYSDQLLVKELRRKNKKVFKDLFYKYHTSLVYFANRYTYNQTISEDIIQDFFFYIWENSNSIHIKSSLKSYLFAGIKNRCLNYLRDIAIHDKHNIIYAEAILELQNNSKEEDVVTLEIFNQVIKIIESLPKQMQTIFEKKYLQNYSIQEIALELQISPNTIKTQLNRAKKRIRSEVHNPLLLLLFTLLFFYLMSPIQTQWVSYTKDSIKRAICR